MQNNYSKTRTGGVIPQITRHPISFSVSFFAVFLITFAFLSFVGATPDPVRSELTSAGTEPEIIEEELASESPEAPVRVSISAAGVNTPVANPTSLNMSVLDQALVNGVARYPTSAMLGMEGTVLIFGHSSRLPIIRNKAYKAFNNIEKLESGEVISVFSKTAEYRYRVIGVKVANATEDVIKLPQTGRYLVLVTCDNFASDKSARFIVTAELVAAHPLN